MDQVVTHEFAEHSHPHTIYCQRFTERDYQHTRARSWSTDATVDELFDKAKSTMFASRHADGWGTCAVEFDEGFVYLALSQGSVTINTAAATFANSEALIDKVREWLPVAERELPDEVSIKFWSLGPQGPQAHRRRIVVPDWSEIEDNYTQSVRDGLGDLMALENGQSLQDGQLILWQGEPGTGKTYALRALTRSWAKWCEFNYIVDPERFFGSSSDYMMNVLLSNNEPYSFGEDDEDSERWKLLILEDSGELLAADAKQQVGQALSRLLNVVDGLIGQGLRLLVLVTTNEPVKKLHPAVSRHGRCAQQLEYKPLTVDEHEAWCEKHGVKVAKSSNLSDLYAEKLLKPGRDGRTNGKAPVGFAV